MRKKTASVRKRSASVMKKSARGRSSTGSGGNGARRKDAVPTRNVRRRRQVNPLRRRAVEEEERRQELISAGRRTAIFPSRKKIVCEGCGDAPRGRRMTRTDKWRQVTGPQTERARRTDEEIISAARAGGGKTDAGIVEEATGANGGRKSRSRQRSGKLSMLRRRRKGPDWRWQR